MRLTSFALITMILGAAGSLQATEFYHQAEAGELEFTASFQGLYSKTRLDSGAESEGYDLIAGFQVEKTFGEKWATGVLFGYGYGELEDFGTDRDSDGLEDVELYLKSFIPTASGSFRYGLALTVALEDKEIQSDGYSNRFSGGIGSRLYLGYEHEASPHVLGFRVSQEFTLGDRLEVSDTGGQVEVKGSEELEVAFYYEKPSKNSAYWGGIFSYTLTSDREANGVLSENMSPILRWSLYRPTPIGSHKLIPRITLGMGSSDKFNGAELDEHTEAQLNLAYRF